MQLTSHSNWIPYYCTDPNAIQLFKPVIPFFPPSFAVIMITTSTRHCCRTWNATISRNDRLSWSTYMVVFQTEKETNLKKELVLGIYVQIILLTEIDRETSEKEQGEYECYVTERYFRKGFSIPIWLIIFIVIVCHAALHWRHEELHKQVPCYGGEITVKRQFLLAASKECFSVPGVGRAVTARLPRQFATFQWQQCSPSHGAEAMLFEDV